jgi:hypothetical protein
VFGRIRIRIKWKGRIRIRSFYPDPPQSEMQDPDPHQSDADQQLCIVLHIVRLCGLHFWSLNNFRIQVGKIDSDKKREVKKCRYCFEVLDVFFLRGPEASPVAGTTFMGN